MELLVLGPCALDSGPVGRCSSRGWIRHVEFDDIGRGVYELTASGHALVEQCRATVASASLPSILTYALHARVRGMDETTSERGRKRRKSRAPAGATGERLVIGEL
jgi:hypothetical protein